MKKKKLDVVTQADYSFNRLYMCLSLMMKIVKKALNGRVELYSIQHNTNRQVGTSEELHLVAQHITSYLTIA